MSAIIDHEAEQIREKRYKTKKRAHELNIEMDKWRKEKNIPEDYNIETLAAFVFTKIAALEIENENMRRDIMGLL